VAQAAWVEAAAAYGFSLQSPPNILNGVTKHA